MDFAALMAAELSKAKPKSESSKKYTKQSEVEAQRVAAYEAEQARAAAAREAKAQAKRQREEELAEEDHQREEKRRRLAAEARARREEREAEEERARRKRLGLPEVAAPAAEGSSKDAAAKQDDSGDGGDDGGEDETFTEEEAVRRLRELGQPVMLFGESADGRARRLRRRIRAAEAKANAAATGAAARGPIATTLAFVPEKDMKVAGTVPRADDAEGRLYLFRQLVSYFSMVLGEYQRAMEAERRDTIASRTAYSAMEQCRENMKPLFRKFEKSDIDDSLLAPIVEIVKAAQERRYVDANDGYLRLSIGKAAWPIGVTMVGIHERSAREKLHGGERGHVMGDEATRKFLQSIKRCLTFAQVRWPPEDLGQLMG